MKTKNYILAILLLIRPLGIIAQSTSVGKNRYGMVLVTNKDGELSLRRDKMLQDVLPNLDKIEDIYVPYKYKPNKIKPSDFTDCRTIVVNYKTAINGDSLRLEIDLPTKSTTPSPFVVWIHGGGWKSGAPKAFTGESQYCASRGIAGIRVQYLLRPHSPTIDEQIKDIAHAVEFVISNKDRFNINPDIYAFVGGSAGAHLATMSAINDNKAKGFVGLYGVYDIKYFFDFLNKFSAQNRLTDAERIKFFHLNDNKKYSKINPTTAIHRDTPQGLIIHGTGDSTAPYEQCEMFVKRMKENEIDVELITHKYYEHNHTGRGASDVYEESLLRVYTFLHKVLR